MFMVRQITSGWEQGVSAIWRRCCPAKNPYNAATMKFAERSERSQILRLRRDASSILEQYPIRVARFSCINHGFNTTFRIDTTDGHKYALRINVNSRRPEGGLFAEVSWLEALRRDTDLVLPKIVPRKDGALISRLESATLGRSTFAVLFEWLPGRDLGNKATPAQLFALGAATAKLHQHGKGYSLPKGASLWSGRDVCLDSKLTLPTHPMPEAWQAVFASVYQNADTVLQALYARERPHALHADLHLWNVKSVRGTLSIFDFDDSISGLPIQDLAISVFYLRRLAGGEQLEAALFEGYQSIQALPTFSSSEFEALVAARQYLLVNDLLHNENAELQAMSAKYLETSVGRLTKYLETGRFPQE
jgi:Ser/Thr protein kinase RdoA (MazF antagonist)